MKKFLVIFGILCGLMPPANASKYYGCSGPQKQYDIDHDFHAADHDLFCYVENNKWNCFKSDSDYCADGTVVCILGSNNNGKEVTLYGGNAGHATCRWAQDRSEDTWELTKAKINGDNYRNIDDCKNKKWQQNDEIEKNNAILVVNNVAYKSANGYPMQFKTYPQATYNTAPAHPNICIGYYCKGPNGKYQEPCDDGSCSASCDSSISTESGGAGGSGDGGDDGDDGNGSNDQTSTPTDVKHTGTVVPYMDALKSCAGK